MSSNINIEKGKHHTRGFDICINVVDIKPNNSVKLLGITLDNKLNFENHITSIINLQTVN